jgi:outer membrane protein TolC
LLAEYSLAEAQTTDSTRRNALGRIPMLTRQPTPPASCRTEANVSLVRTAQLCALLIVFSGCSTTPKASSNVAASGPPQFAAAPAPHPALEAQTGAPTNATPGSSTRLVSAVEPLPEVVPHPPGEIVDPLTTADELLLDELIEGVLTRNQSLAAMVAAWRSAAQRYPQAVSLEDPMFNSAIAPAGIGSNEVTGGYMVGGAQKLPWFGKRYWRGQQARADANAAYMDVGDARLQLIQATQIAFYEYYLAARQVELNAENMRSLSAFRDDARKRYEANLVTQQDVLQADVELALLERRQVELDRNRLIAIARINTLLHRVPDFPLAPPPGELPGVEELPPVDELRLSAIASRPDLAALGARVRAEGAALELAHKDYLPDVEVMGRYDAFWQEQPLQAMVGLNANVPIYRRRLDAAVCEAGFRLSQRRAQYRQRVDDINREVQTAYEQLKATQDLVDLYERRTIPASKQNVESARVGYVAGRVDFLRLIEAERQLIGLLQDEQDLLASYHAQRAELERVVGGPLPSAAGTDALRLQMPQRLEDR